MTGAAVLPRTTAAGVALNPVAAAQSFMIFTEGNQRGGGSTDSYSACRR